MVDVFFSHASEDDDIVDLIDDEFVARRIRTWVDHKNIEFGQHWEDEIERALEACTCGLVVLSHNSVKSQFAHNEWNKMSNMNKERIYVLKIHDIPDKMLPVSLHGIHYANLVPYVNNGSREVIDKLVKQAKAACCNGGVEPQSQLILRTTSEIDIQGLADLLNDLSDVELQQLQAELQKQRGG